MKGLSTHLQFDGRASLRFHAGDVMDILKHEDFCWSNVPWCILLYALYLQRCNVMDFELT